MKCKDINIRDPFVLFEDGKFYMYGTRAQNFGRKTGGFDVYVSDDLENWQTPFECFNSAEFGMNECVNWAPEVHKYKGSYYMFATFTRKNGGLRGTFILKSDSPAGPFVPHSNGVVTPDEWECLDGTLYIDRQGKPYIVFCHEHTQIIDGTVCYRALSDDLTHAVGDAVTVFPASSCPYVTKTVNKSHYVTDGPFMFRSSSDELFMIWSSFIDEKYAELLVKFNGGEIGTEFSHLPPILDSDGGHGMIFSDGKELYLTFHSPNASGYEHPCFIKIAESENGISAR